MGILSRYTYDGMGRRIKQTLDASNINVSETSKLYDQDLLEELMTDDNGLVIKDKKSINYVYDVTSEENDVLLVYGKHTETNRYIYGMGLISIDSWHEEEESWSKVSQDNFDVTLYYVKDVLGSTRTLVDDSNKINKVYDYDVFGTPVEKNHVNDQGIRTNIYHYAGYIYDYATSQYFVNARYYQPETGRFVAKDLLLVDGFNRYKYVRNNPLNYSDPLGLLGEGLNEIKFIEFDPSYVDMDNLNYSIVFVPNLTTIKYYLKDLALIVAGTFATSQLPGTSIYDGDRNTLHDFPIWNKSIFDGLYEFPADENKEIKIYTFPQENESQPKIYSFPTDRKTVLDQFYFYDISDNLNESWSSKVEWTGNPHRNGTIGHWEAIVSKVNELIIQDDVAKVYINKGLSNEVELDGAPNRRPDIMAVNSDGSIDIYEVPSKADSIEDLIDRSLDNLEILGERAGNYFIVPID